MASGPGGHVEDSLNDRFWSNWTAAHPTELECLEHRCATCQLSRNCFLTHALQNVRCDLERSDPCSLIVDHPGNN